MTNFILIGVCIIAGYIFQRSNTLPKDAHKGINAWIIYIALPAFSFKFLPHIHWTKELILPAISPLIVWLCSWCYIRFYAYKTRIDKASEGGLKLTAGLSNTSFVGFPLILAYFTEKDLSIAIIYDQANFLLLATAGIIVALNTSQKQVLSVAAISKKVFTFPPFLGCVTALILPQFVDISALDPFWDKLAATVGPLALFSIGLQIKFNGWQQEVKHISFALFYKLLIAPAIILSVAVLMGISGRVAHISVFEAAMPTLLTSGIVADQYNLNPKLSNLVIGIGILLSFITTCFWHWFMMFFI